jgi:hypothetical protein
MTSCQHNANAMTIFDLIRQMMPDGTEAFATTTEGQASDYGKCPSWPVDLFAVVGSIIDRSGCYTMASPDRADLGLHEIRLLEIGNCAAVWNGAFNSPPEPVQSLWADLAGQFAGMKVSEISKNLPLVSKLLVLFGIADEASAGIGWDVDPKEASQRMFASLAFAGISSSDPADRLPYAGKSMCVMVPPDQAIVLPKSITSSVGCTIRSLSHHLALLPPVSVLEPEWILSSITPASSATSERLRLLLVPFPFTIHADSFKLSSAQQQLGKSKLPAYFSLEQRWLDVDGVPLTGERLANGLIQPLIDAAKQETGEVPNGIVLPECALSSKLAGELVQALAASGIEFLITGVLDTTPDGKQFNRALTFSFQENGTVAMAEQNKHHRWRLDRTQTERYALDFDPSADNNQWWEDIDVSSRRLPFFGLRKDMSLVTLICEDLARTDPAMPAIRAVGPNLVIALLMDGPQLAVRWPGRYATVLAEDPGSAVLSFTCAAMVDRSNWREAKPARSIGLWRDGRGATQEIGLPDGALGVVLSLQSRPKHQTTLDGRSDGSTSRQLTLRTVVPLFLAP